MNTVRSADGTTIAYTRAGQGPPLILVDTRPPMPDDYLPRLKQLVADGRPGDAVNMFMRFVGTPAIFTAND